MANMLIKILITIILGSGLYSPTSIATNDNNFKQCFYMVSNEQKSKDLREELSSISNMGVPLFVILDPSNNMHIKMVDVLKEFQETMNLKILVLNDSELQSVEFIKKNIASNLKISGTCTIGEQQVIYTGKNKIRFELIEISSDPLKTIAEIDTQNSYNTNKALVVNSGEFNISTLILAYQELRGEPLSLSNYTLNFDNDNIAYDIFTYIGYTTIVLFATSIVIFLLAIVRFKKFSKEKFLNR